MIGTSLGRYRILDQLGAGTMGEVYRAHDESLGRVLALKTIKDATSAKPDAERIARFRREAQAVAGLNHPNIVTVYDFGEADGSFYLAMELLDGRDLAEVMRARLLPLLGEKLDLMAQVCEGVAFAHARGIVHRDLKPANVHRLPGGRVKILDFGLAQMEQGDLTHTGAVLGTPYYMSPEQVRGERVDARADVFALGALFYELLSGRRAFPAGSLHAVLFQILEREPEPLAAHQPDLPELADRILRKALAKEAIRRFRDAAELGEAVRRLQGFVAGEAPEDHVLALLGEPEVDPASATWQWASPGDAPLRAVASASASAARTGAAAAAPGASRPADASQSAARSTPAAPARVTYRGEKGGDRVMTAASREATLLDLALQSGIPHYHECGGRARCSTCRVRVLAGAGQLGPRTAEEARLAARLGWGDDIRLACQVRASGDVTVQRLIFDADDVGLLLGEQRKPTPAREMALAVMACGLMDFAVFARRFTPYDVVHVLNRFYLLAGEPVLSNGGTLQSYRDDGLVALFGLGGEEAKERCLKAVRAALRVAARMSELNAYLREHFGQELRLGVGLHFGRTIVGQIGHPSRLELSAIGGATSVAQRVRDLNRRRETCLLATEELVNVVEGDVSLGALLHDEESLDGRQLAVHEILDFNKRDAVLLVQESFEKVARRRAEAAALFYELLFQIDPGSRALFARTDMAVQGEMLMSVLAAAVKGLDRIEELRPTLLELGRRHVGYGVEPSHYASVEAALLEMVRRMSGEEFGIDVRLAWARIYSELTAVMLEGAADPAA